MNLNSGETLIPKVQQSTKLVHDKAGLNLELIAFNKNSLLKYILSLQNNGIDKELLLQIHNHMNALFLIIDHNNVNSIGEAKTIYKEKCEESHDHEYNIIIYQIMAAIQMIDSWSKNGNRRPIGEISHAIKNWHNQVVSHVISIQKIVENHKIKMSAEDISIAIKKIDHRIEIIKEQVKSWKNATNYPETEIRNTLANLYTEYIELKSARDRINSYAKGDNES